MQKFSRNIPSRPQLNRINHQIRISPIRVVRDGEQLGVMPTSQALRMAQDEGLDLVEVAPTARPPVCHIMDFGKFRFDQSIKEKESRKKQKSVQDKEIRLSPVVDEHDLVTKANQAKGFLEEGKRVQFLLKFKGRSIVHKDLGFEVLNKMLEQLTEVATVEVPPRMEGRTITCRVSPKKDKEK
jgi:translation initiation factor IF-3